MNAMPEGGGPRKPARCPICGKPAEAGNRPFCSPRCKDLDLGRWLDGRYAIPTEEAPGEPPPVTDRDEQE